jgi:glycosyltransferase involved in cell wall biosynthesis
MRPLVSVITATIPERAKMLAECKASVQAQSYPRVEHIVERDDHREGCSVMVNRAVARAEGDWLLPLADDDLILPRCVEILLAHSADADIVYSPPLVWGLHDPWWFFQAPPAIPATALVRASLWRDLGGYDESARREEDRKLWTRAVDAGARFVRADEQPTWVYRVHGANKSLAGQQIAVGAAT